MTDFATLLEQSLSGVNDPYENAVADLERIVGEISKSVQKALGSDLFSVELIRFRDTPRETVFNLAFKQLQKFSHGPSAQAKEIGAYRVTLDGYPISFGSVNGESKFEALGEIKDVDELNEHFREMLSNPSSPLVVYVAYLRRRGNRN